MNKKLALVVYPFFSNQEIANLCSLFKWHFNSEVVVFASNLNQVNSEEGINVVPSKTFDDFVSDDYDCLVLAGCSDLRLPLRDDKLKSFLEGLKDKDELIIGAISGAPVFLSQAGLLKNKKFTNSLFVEMNKMFNFVEEENLVYEPLVEQGNIVTAVGFAFNEFAITLARKIGYECPDKIFTGIPAEYDAKFYKYHLDDTGMKMFKEEFSDFIK